MRILTRVAFLLVVLCASAIVVRAQTAISPGSLTGDPTIKYKGGDPPTCVPPFCYNLDYTGPVFDPMNLATLGPATAFFAADPLDPIPPMYSCEASGGLSCSVDVTPTHFYGVDVIFETDGDFTLLVEGAGPPLGLDVPKYVSCLDISCSTGQTLMVDLTPEPATAILFLTGLLLLGYAVRKYEKVSRPRERVRV